MRWWILFGCGVLVVAAAIWPFGRKTEQLGTVPMPPLVASNSAPAPQAEPARIVEVIDLARAYEPVREPEEPAGSINPASFIQVPEGPKRIPPAIDLGDGPRVERIDVMPRVVATNQNGLLSFVPTASPSGEFTFTPMSVPYEIGITQPIPPNAAIVPTEKLNVMPREVGKVKREERERTLTPEEAEQLGIILPR